MMASFRRSMSVMQRDRALQNGEETFDISSPPKLPHNRTHLVLGRLLNSFSNSLDFPGIFWARASHSVERSKPKGIHMRRSFFHYSICFMLGIFISFTPFFSVDVSKNLASKQNAFSIEDGVLVDNTQRKIGSVEKEILVIGNQVSTKNHSLETVENWEVKSEAHDASQEIPASYLNSPFQDAELVPQKLLVIVTPTYERPFQAYYLNRLAHTLRVVSPPLLWIVVEMSSQSIETAKILRGAGVMYRHLVCNQNLTGIKNKEVHQRNVALSHIEKHQLDGIVHFADDDRMYSVDLFDQMRQIRLGSMDINMGNGHGARTSQELLIKLGMTSVNLLHIIVYIWRLGTWPVAMLSESKDKVLLEGPVCNDSQVIGWYTNQKTRLSRRFHVDMSGFAFNSTILWDTKTWHRPTLEPIRQNDRAREGFQETTFIEQLVEDESQMEGFPRDCSRIMVWHLHLEAPELLYPNAWLIPKNLEVVAPLT